MRSLGWLRSIGAIGLLAALLGGCLGYSVGGELPEGVETVHVPIFRNRTRRRQIEYQLTDEVARQLVSRAGARIVREGDADMEIRGEIVAYSLSVLGENRARESETKRVAVTVAVTIRNLRTGELLRNGTRVTRSATFVTGRGETEGQARRTTMGRVATGIVELLYDTW